MQKNPGNSRRYVVPPDALKIPVWARAREYTEEALMILVGIMRNEDNPAGIRAGVADSIIDRGWGKAPILINSEVNMSHSLELGAIDPAKLLALESTLMALVAPQPNLRIALEKKAPEIIEGEVERVDEGLAKSGYKPSGQECRNEQ